MTEDLRTARVVKKIVIGYKLPVLPTFLMRSIMLLRNKLVRAGFRIEVVLAPLSQLPADADLLFVAAELLAEARQIVSAGQEVIPLTAATAQQPAYDDLLKQLGVGQVLYAEKLEEEADQLTSEDSITMHYRGNTRLI